MSDQFPCNFKSYDMGQSSRNENCYDVPADSWLQSFPSLNNSDFQDIFEVLTTSGQTDTSVTSKLELPFQRDKNGRSTGTVRKLEEMDTEISKEELKRKQVKQTRKRQTAQDHKMCERQRRVRIKERVKILQELIPNCTKSDQASVLDDAVKYLIELKLQIENLSARRGVAFQAPDIPPSGGIRYMQQVSQFSPSVGMFSSNTVPGMMSVPWATSLHPSLSASPGLPLMSFPGNHAHAAPRQQIPYAHSQQLPTSINESAVMLPNFATSVSPQFNFSTQWHQQH